MRGGTGVTSISALKSALGISSSGSSNGYIPFNVTWTTQFNKSVTVTVPAGTENYETITTSIGTFKKNDNYDLLYMEISKTTVSYSGSNNIDAQCGISTARGSTGSSSDPRFTPGINLDQVSNGTYTINAKSIYIGARNIYEYTSRDSSTYAINDYYLPDAAIRTNTHNNTAKLTAGIYLNGYSGGSGNGNLVVTMQIKVLTGKIS